MSDQVQFPLGVRFAPIDEELIIYLNKKIKNESLPYNGIFSINIYKYNPWELTEMYPTLGKDEWYFFTTRDRKYPNGSRPNRAAGGGYWKATVADQKIYDNINDCIGFKKTLVFYEGNPPKGKKTNWIMHEYTVDHPPIHPRGTNDNMQLEDCVLCHIYERKKTAATESSKTEQHIQEQRNLLVQQPNFESAQQPEDSLDISLGMDLSSLDIACRSIFGLFA